MRWTPSKMLPLAAAICIILMGMWIIYQGTDGVEIETPVTTVVNAPVQVEPNPAAFGFAMLAGGVLLIFMTFRKS